MMLSRQTLGVISRASGVRWPLFGDAFPTAECQRLNSDL